MSSPHFDIRRYKKDLRAQYKAMRKNILPSEKLELDNAVFENIIAMPQYTAAKTVLTFVSTPLEVDTHKLIRHALQQGKTVAVPYCLEGTRKMEFYKITSMDQLAVRTFGVLEPVAESCEKLTDYTDSICLLPGYCFDRLGYRLGYGGGYYDRFLSKVYTGVKIGICYQYCIRRHLHHGKFDVPCNWLVTDAAVRKAIVPVPRKGKGKGHSRHKKGKPLD